MTIEIEKLKRTTFINQLVFAYVTCERLYPNYVYFSTGFSFGDITALRKGIDHIKEIIVGKQINEKILLSLIDKVHSNIPDTEDFQTIFVSSALDASCAIIEALEFLIDEKFEHIAAISTFATDSVYMYIQSRDSIDSNAIDCKNHIFNDPLMKKEVAIQKRVISVLLSGKSLKSADIDFLLELQGELGNLRLG